MRTEFLACIASIQKYLLISPPGRRQIRSALKAHFIAITLAITTLLNQSTFKDSHYFVYEVSFFSRDFCFVSASRLSFLISLRSSHCSSPFIFLIKAYLFNLYLTCKISLIKNCVASHNHKDVLIEALSSSASAEPY